jgi:hypothetical protein
MRPDTSRWRDESAYDYLDTIPASGLAWECLRRNRDYQNDYALTLGGTGDLKRAEERLMRRWGLRFRGQAEPDLAGPERLLDAAKS